MPKALFGGVVAIMACYVLVNLGLLTMLPLDMVASSKLPAAEAAARLFGPSGHLIVQVFAIVSLCRHPQRHRHVHAAHRVRDEPGRVAPVAAEHARIATCCVPGFAMIVCVVPAMVLAVGLTFETLFSITAFLGLAANLISFAAYFKLRHSEPELERPFKAWGYPWLPLLITIVSAALVGAFVVADPLSSGLAIAAMLLAVPVFAIASRPRAALP